jgi:hypothetical protein
VAEGNEAAAAFAHHKHIAKGIPYSTTKIVKNNKENYK